MVKLIAKLRANNANGFQRLSCHTMTSEVRGCTANCPSPQNGVQSATSLSIKCRKQT